MGGIEGLVGFGCPEQIRDHATNRPATWLAQLVFTGYTPGSVSLARPTTRPPRIVGSGEIDGEPGANWCRGGVARKHDRVEGDRRIVGFTGGGVVELISGLDPGIQVDHQVALRRDTTDLEEGGELAVGGRNP